MCLVGRHACITVCSTYNLALKFLVAPRRELVVACLVCVSHLNPVEYCLLSFCGNELLGKNAILHKW